MNERLTVKIGRKTYTVADHAEASALFTAAQVETCKMTGKWLKGAKLSDGCHITNNGRVWDGEWFSGKTPTFDPSNG